MCSVPGCLVCFSVLVIRLCVDIWLYAMFMDARCVVLDTWYYAMFMDIGCVCSVQYLVLCCVHGCLLCSVVLGIWYSAVFIDV